MLKQDMLGQPEELGSFLDERLANQPTDRTATLTNF